MQSPTLRVVTARKWSLGQGNVFTVRKLSCGKIMFSHLSVSHSVHRGHAWQGACVTWGYAWWGHTWQEGVCGGDMHGRGHAWWGGGEAWQMGVCMAGGGMHGRRDGHCSRQYAFYWNAFLSHLSVSHSVHRVEVCGVWWKGGVVKGWEGVCGEGVVKGYVVKGCGERGW